MKAEVDAVVARQQERVADWEAAVAEEEAALAAKQQELQVLAPCICEQAASPPCCVLLASVQCCCPPPRLWGHSRAISNDRQAIVHGFHAIRFLGISAAEQEQRQPSGMPEHS